MRNKVKDNGDPRRGDFEIDQCKLLDAKTRCWVTIAVVTTYLAIMSAAAVTALRSGHSSDLQAVLTMLTATVNVLVGYYLGRMKPPST